MTDRELMQQAFNAMEQHFLHHENGCAYLSEIYEALRARLAQGDVPETAFGETEPVAMKFQIYKSTPPRGRELEPINSALLPWVYDQDPSSGNTASMRVTPLATLPPKKEWVGLTDEEYIQIAIDCGCLSADWGFYGAAIERKLKGKNNG